MSRVANTRAHGIDLVMNSPKGIPLNVEAKGQTSERLGSSRYDVGFSSSQKLDHFGVALARATLGISRGERWAIALPGDDYDRKLVQARKVALDRLSLTVLEVNPETQRVSMSVGRLPR